MIKRIWKVIVLFGSMLLICGCGKEKLSEEDILQKINTTGEYGENLEWQLYDGAFGITLAIGGSCIRPLSAAIRAAFSGQTGPY